MNVVLRRFRFSPKWGPAVLLMICSLFVALLLLPAFANAQPASQGFPRSNSMASPEDEKACGHDARRLCRSVLEQGDMAVLACFQKNRAQLSRACMTVLRAHGQIP